jgi:type I restriction enzyme S subunit
MVIKNSEYVRLKYAASINDETLSETTDVDYELQYIDIGNVNSAGEVLDIVTYTFENAPSRARRKVQHGDVIVSTVRTYLKAIAPIENPANNLIVSTGFAVVRPRTDILSPRYCKYLLREPSFLAEVERRSVGVSYPAINASDLGDIMVRIPSLEIQDEIADLLDRETTRINKLVNARKKQVELLIAKRSSIIFQAISGNKI